nr:ionotropic receptor IR75q.1 [Spodoptera frugiperda]
MIVAHTSYVIFTVTSQTVVAFTMKYLTFFLNIICLNFCVSLNTNSKLQIIVDIAKSFNKPTSVVAKMCWESNKRSKYAPVEAKLAKMLANLDRPMNIRYLRANETIENDNYPNNDLLFIMNRTCEDANAFLRWASANHKFRKSYRWLILGKSLIIKDETFKVSPEFDNIRISVDSEVIIIEENNTDEVSLHTFYKLKPHTQWIIEDYGNWSPITGFIKSRTRIESNVMRRKDFMGETLITSVAISDNSTKTDLLGLGNIFIDTPAKSSFRTIVPLFDFLNATKVVIFSDTWGYFINGSWNGMIGDISRGEADLCGIVTFITKERMTILEYLTHPTPITLKFVFRQPPLSYQNNLFLLPFSTGVWLCTGAFIVILIAILYINTRWDAKKYKYYNKQKIDQTCLPPTWSDITIFVLSAISQQGSSNELKGTLGRLVMFLVFLAFVFLYTSYSANIVVLLQSTSNQIRTLSDLLHSRLELGLEHAPFNKFYFSSAYTADDPIKKALVDTKIAPKGVLTNVMNIEQGVRIMQKRPFAFNMNTGTGYRIVSAIFQEHEKCGLQEIEYIPNSNPWLCSRRLSPYGELFKVGYIRIQEHGLSDRENRLIYAKKPACTVMGGSFGSVNMVDFHPVCLVLLYGMILAFLLLGVEILVHRKQMKIRNQAVVE